MEEQKKYREGEERLLEYIARITAIKDKLHNAPPEEQNPGLEALLGIVLQTDHRTLKCLNEGLPMVTSWYGNANEITHAMGIHTEGIVFNLLLHEYFTDLKDLYAMDTLPLPDDICSLVRLGTYGQRNNLLVKPGAVIGMMEPCDAQPLLHDSFRMHGWDDIPYFFLDYPYGNTDEDWDYFAGELYRMIDFLEETFPGYKLDYDLLKEIVEETNRQYELWDEFSQMQRIIPCPGPSFGGSTPGWALTQHHAQGDPQITQIFRGLVAGSAAMVKAGKGAVPNEKIRILWADLDPQWGDQLAPWLAEKYGAVVAQSFQGYTPFEPVDTSTPEKMIRGLAKRAIYEVPMIRQARGTVDTVLEDIETIVKDYSCNCVFVPAHMGHKDVSAGAHFIRDLCRDLGVPVLFLNVSLFDERYLPIDQLKRKISDFFEATGLAYL